MKAPGFAFLLSSLVASGDVLSDFSPFLGSPGPDYDPSQLESDFAMENQTFAPFSPADSDFGVQQILSPRPACAPLEIFFRADINYTDNAPAATRQLEDNSWYVSALLGAAWRPHIGKGWFADLGAYAEIFRFDQSNATDFENMQPYVGVVKTLVDLDDTVFFARYEYQRLTTGSISEGDYSAQRLRTGLQKDLLLTSRQQLAGGISVAYDLDANPERLERIEYAVDLSYTWWFSNRMNATASWRGAYWDFDNGGRKDWNHTAGIELAYRICENATAYSNVFYSNNDSNSPLGINDFESWQVGLGLGLNFQF